MIAHVKFNWCHVAAFLALADERWWVQCREDAMWEAFTVLEEFNVGAHTVLPSKHPGELAAPLGLLPLSFLEILHLSSQWSGERSLLVGQSCDDHCYLLSQGQLGVQHGAPVATGTQVYPKSGHGACSITFPAMFGACVVSSWSHGKCCHHSCLFFCKTRDDDFPCLSIRQLSQHWILASFLKIL